MLKKTGSEGNIFLFEQQQIPKNNLRPIIAFKNNKFQRAHNFPLQNLNSFESDIYNNNYNFDHRLLNKTPKQLYDGLMSLKKKVNYLNEEISLAKSAQRKKDVQLNLKNKEIEGYISDIKMCKDLTPINVNKLKEFNIITKLKKEYISLKNTLNELKNKKNNLEIKLKKSKPNIAKQKNLFLEKRIKNVLMEYNILHKNNSTLNKQLEDVKNLPHIFAENHKIIENLKSRIEDQEKIVNDLKEEINTANNKKNMNDELLNLQKIKNINLNQKNHYLEVEISNRKKIAEMKVNYENKLQKLNEKKTELEEKIRSQDRVISDIKRGIRILEEKKKLDPIKLNAFNYASIEKLESNPQDAIDSKLILLQSLIDESISKKKKYQDSIQACIERFNELEYDYSELDKILENDTIKNNNEEDREEEENKEDKEINDKKEENSNNNINNINNFDKKENIDINNKKDAANQNGNNNVNNEDNNKENNLTNEEIDKKLNENDENIQENNIINNNVELNNKSQTIEENNLHNENNNNKNNIKENKENIINNDSNNNEKEVNNPSEDKKINEIKEEKNNIPEIKDINKDKAINSKEINIKKSSSLPSDEFSEFTFILVKNFEAKKINEEAARQKIIIIPTKEQLEKNTFIEQMSFNIMKSIHCENQESNEKVKKWLGTFLEICEDNQKKMTESFLNLFKEITNYNNEKELIYSKKIKKYLFKKNPEFAKKLEPFKNKYISFQYVKQLLEEQNIDLKDEYSQYLFYELKKFEDKQASIFDLKTDNLFKIFENEQNDSKMEEESDIEITNEQYVNIIYNIGLQLNKYLDTNKKTLREVMGSAVKNISGDKVLDKDKVEVIMIEEFIEKMKEIGITLNSEIEIYCLFSRYKISDEYELISFNLLENDLKNFKQNKEEDIENKNKEDINNDINNLNASPVTVEEPKKNNLKVMEKVQEENEDNISNSENK